MVVGDTRRVPAGRQAGSTGMTAQQGVYVSRACQQAGASSLPPKHFQLWGEGSRRQAEVWGGVAAGRHSLGGLDGQAQPGIGVRPVGRVGRDLWCTWCSGGLLGCCCCDGAAGPCATL